MRGIIRVELREFSLAPELGESFFVLKEVGMAEKKQERYTLHGHKYHFFFLKQETSICGRGYYIKIPCSIAALRRRSSAHGMAQAVLEKFPDGKVAIGPAIDDGFYYDFDLPRSLTPEDLNEIENRHVGYAREVEARLKAMGVRVLVDERGDRMNAKIRDAQNQKIPYMLVVGDKEAAEGAVALRLRSGENPGAVSLATFLERLQADIAAGI